MSIAHLREIAETYEIKVQRKIRADACDCEFCEGLLEEGENTLQIWYGTGCNGKTTLLNKLIENLGEDNVLSIPIDTSREKNEWIWDKLSNLSDNTKLVKIREPCSNDDFKEFALKLKDFKKPGVRYIMTLNKLQDWMSYELCSIALFPHKFC